jgi:hypothetical protein
MKYFKEDKTRDGNGESGRRRDESTVGIVKFVIL